MLFWFRNSAKSFTVISSNLFSIFSRRGEKIPHKLALLSGGIAMMKGGVFLPPRRVCQLKTVWVVVVALLVLGGKKKSTRDTRRRSTVLWDPKKSEEKEKENQEEKRGQQHNTASSLSLLNKKKRPLLLVVSCPCTTTVWHPKPCYIHPEESK